MTDVDLADESTEPRRPHTALVVCLVMAVLVALLVVVLATRDSSTERTTQSPLIGRLAPPTEGDTIDGEPFSVADQRGRWVVLNFFASWCVPCLEEHPELQAFDAAHRADGDAVLVSTTFDDTAEDAVDFFAEHGGTWPVIDDPENSIGVAYGVARVPETFVIAPNGTVVQRFAGPVTRAAALDELIAAYENGEGSPVSPSRRSAFRTGSWFAIALLAAASLAVAAFDDGPPRSTEEQVEAIAKTLKCPVCESQSVADSESASSRAIRAEIARLVEKGQSPGEVRSAIAASFGDEVQLIPSASGFAGLVWILPVVVLTIAVAGVSTALARWRRRGRSSPSDEDRALVEGALRER